MGTVGCQGILSKAPQIPLGLSRLQCIGGNPSISRIGVYVFTQGSLGSFHAEYHRTVTAMLIEVEEKVINHSKHFKSPQSWKASHLNEAAVGLMNSLPWDWVGRQALLHDDWHHSRTYHLHNVWQWMSHCISLSLSCPPICRMGLLIVVMLTAPHLCQHFLKNGLCLPWNSLLTPSANFTTSLGSHCLLLNNPVSPFSNVSGHSSCTVVNICRMNEQENEYFKTAVRIDIRPYVTTPWRLSESQHFLCWGQVWAEKDPLFPYHRRGAAAERCSPPSYGEGIMLAQS